MTLVQSLCGSQQWNGQLYLPTLLGGPTWAIYDLLEEGHMYQQLNTKFLMQLCWDTEEKSMK